MGLEQLFEDVPLKSPRPTPGFGLQPQRRRGVFEDEDAQVYMSEPHLRTEDEDEDEALRLGSIGDRGLVADEFEDEAAEGLFEVLEAAGSAISAALGVLRQRQRRAPGASLRMRD